MSESTKPPRIVLVDGDPILGMDAIIAMKAKWSSNGNIVQWVEFYPPNKKNQTEFLNSLDGEAATPDMCGEYKVVLLRGLVNSKQFKDGLMVVATGVAPNNTLIVFDETGVIRSDLNSKDTSKTGWSMFRDQCVKQGLVLDVPPPFMNMGEVPWGKKFGISHMRAVIAELAKRGKKMSVQTTENVFLEMAMPDWSYILMELDKLAELVPGDVVSPKDVNNIVFPWSSKHAIFEFAVAFNGGNFQDIMDSYDQLVAYKIPNEMVFSYCMKLLRWQLIAAHLMSYGQPLPAALDAIGSLMTNSESVVKTAKLKSMKPHLFKKPKVTNETGKNEESEKDGISSFTSKGVSEFVKNVLSKKMPIRDANLGTLKFMNFAMTRYLAMFECMEEFRLCGDKDRARSMFRQVMLKVCGRGQ